MEGDEIEFSDGFTELHTHSYQQILDGHGFGLEEARNSIQIVHDIRHSNPSGLKGEYHPLAIGELSKHPFSK
jgi:UDP-N-acetyl-2-amino-2-deoxyglucuronate dehydrogenase